MTEVTVVSSDGHRISTSSIDLSSGGMSLKSAEDLPAGTNLSRYPFPCSRFPA